MLGLQEKLQSGKAAKKDGRTLLRSLGLPLLNAALAFAIAFSGLSIISLGAAATTAATPQSAMAATEAVVPNVNGYQLQQAVNTLESQGFSWQIAEGNSNYVGATVIGTDPWSGTTTEYGARITIYTEEQETVIDEISIGYYVDVRQSDGTVSAELIQFPNAEANQYPEIDKRLGSVQLAASVKWRGGSFVLGTDTNSGLSTGDLLWGSSNDSVATVDQNGLVTAAGREDGEAIITCTLMNDNYTPSSATERIKAQIAVKVIGQAGAYPVAVAIVDEYNIPVGADGIVIDATDGMQDYQPYVRVQYNDGSMKCNAPECDPAIYAKEIPGLSWQGGNSKIAYVNSISGTITPIKDATGSTDVTAYVLGGKNGPVKDTIFLIIKGLTSAPPAQTLTVNVVYQGAPDQTVSSKIFTQDTLVTASKNGMWARSAYTQYGSSKWVTIAAEGVYLDELLASVGVNDLSKVYAINTKTTDGKNAGMVAGAFYFERAGYYYPNFWAVNAAGVHNTSGGVRVQPMVAVRAYQIDGRDGDAETAEADFTKMTSDRAFWLVDGANGGLPASREHSTYYTYEMTVLLKGLPQTEFGDGEGEGNGDGGGDVIGDGNGGQGGTGDNQDAVGGDDGTGDENGDRVVQGVGGAQTDASLNDAQQDSGAAAETAYADAETSGAQGDSHAEQEESEQPSDTNDAYSVYQMMTRSDNNLDVDYDNPLEGLVLPAAAALAALSGTTTAVRQRDEQGKSFKFMQRLRAGSAKLLAKPRALIAGLRSKLPNLHKPQK